MAYGDTYYGKWIKAVEVNPVAFSGSFYATGSYEGAAGIIVGVLPSPTIATGSVTLTDGGTVDVDFLAAGQEYNFSIQHVSMSQGRVWVLYKNPNAQW